MSFKEQWQHLELRVQFSENCWMFIITNEKLIAQMDYNT
jgi:hypothetical protein